MKKLFLILFCTVLLVGTVYALEFDNKLDEKDITFDGKSIKGNKLLEQYKPIEIVNTFGFGKILMEGYLSQHTDFCGVDCLSTIEINLLEDGVLVDDIVFKTLQKDGSWIEQDIRSYQFYVNGEPYNVGTELKAGRYQVLLRGEKKPSRTVDWQITSQGKLIDEWAVWAGIVSCNRNSPEYCMIIEADTLDISAVQVNGVVVTEISTGVWKLNATSDYNLSRAKILGTLFYGVADGNNNYVNPRIFNITNVKRIISNNPLDDNSTIVYAESDIVMGVNGQAYQNFTFTNPTGNRISSWSNLQAGDSQNTDWWKIPFDLTYPPSSPFNEATAAWSSEIGTDRSADERNDTVGNFGGYGGDDPGGQTHKFRILLLLSNGTIGNSSVTLTGLSQSISKSTITYYMSGLGYPVLEYTDAFVTLNSPSDNYVSNISSNNLSCFAMSPSSYIVNMSLYINITGSWVINQTADYSSNYVVWIIADSLLESEFNTNDCTIRKINNTIWKLTSTGTYEVQRAKIMQTLFYNGAILNATNVQKLITSDTDDIGMRGHNITYSCAGAPGYTANGTFSDTTNNFKSSMWTDLAAGQGGISGTPATMNAEFAVGNQINTISHSNSAGTSYSYEVGTDTSGDELNNPVNCEFNYAGNGISYSSGKAGVLILSVGSIGWSDTGGTFSEIDYTDDHSIPVFSGNETYESFNINIENSTEWACQACDSDGDCGMSLENRTISTELSIPEVLITYPTEIVNQNIIGGNETLNWTVSDPNLDACWYDYNNTNTTVTCNDNTTSFILVEDWYNITFWANDTFAHINSSYLEWTYKILQNSQTYNLITYETASETFSINLTANSSLTDVNLIHNTISHDTTLSGTTYSTTFDIPNSVGNKTVYWEFIYAGSTINSDSFNQTVNNALLGICNVSLTVPYVNFTFVDEETLNNINATIDTSTWIYYLGNGTITKSLLFSNTTVNDNYAFCLSASNYTLHNTRSIQYASPGYPQRKYDAVSDLTNDTTNQVLYLLSSTDGIYTSIQVLDSQSNQLLGVGVTTERQFLGVWTIIGQEITDSSGSVTFWGNPDYDHRFTFVKTGCTGTTVTIRPTQTQYTQQLACGVTSDYTSTIEGLKYSRSPTGGILQAGVYNFTYYLVSSKANIINASFYLVNATDQTVLNSSVSACTPSGCLLYFTYNVTQGENLKGRYYVDVGNGSMLIEGDAWWRCFNIPTAGKAGISTFFKDMMYVFQEWGSDTDTADFNRLVTIFFLICIGISVLNYNFNMDSLNPGMFLSILTFFIIMGSLIGGTNPTVTNHGLFYYNNLTTSGFINNYLLAFICTIISFSSFLNVNRQAQR